ncbi:MAG TPA: alpha/beta hydrolase [Flavobacteriaceae bacterium]|nr:alpha/beta hydrolase [Flavobacteriaceae bacterium]
MNLKKEIHITILFLLLGWVLTAQVERPNAKPYTIQTTYEKLLKKHPDIFPIQELKSPDIVADENITYSSVDSYALTADVYYPVNSKKPCPAVILVHGGGWISGSKENQRVMAQHLAQNGFVAMTVNYRLADVAKYPAAVEDLNAAVDFLYHSKYPLEKDKMAILGASAGAQLAALIGVKNSKIKAIVNVDGIVSFIHPEAEEGQYAGYWLGGMKAGNFETWKAASALEFINPKSPPVLFINSSQPRFHAGRDDMVTKYNEWNIYSEVHTIPDSPHSFWLVNPWFQPTLNYTVEFLTKVFNP